MSWRSLTGVSFIKQFSSYELRKSNIINLKYELFTTKIRRTAFDETGPEQVHGTLHGYVRRLVDCKNSTGYTGVCS